MKETGSKRRIAVVTGSRADYGLLYWILRDLKNDPNVDLCLIATGMHLSPEFGLTYKAIEDDGFRIHERVEMLLSSDTPAAIAKSIGLAVIGFADLLARLQPSILLVLGDRFEIFAAAQAAMVANIPLAHIAGGDSTEGAIDESIRHSITKMAHLHFVTNEAAAMRVRQMGEAPANVYNFGSPGIDYIRKVKLLTRAQLARELGCTFCERNLLVTFHPETLSLDDSARQFAVLLESLDALGEEVGVFFTHANADTGGRRLTKMLEAFVAGHRNAYSYTSLGQVKYLSLMRAVDAVLGNSSSGLYEAPSLHKPTVNIGARQHGRLLADSVVNCEASREGILKAVQEALTRDCSHTINPYGDGHASERIAAVLKSVPDPRQLLKKRFHLMAGADTSSGTRSGKARETAAARAKSR